MRTAIITGVLLALALPGAAQAATKQERICAHRGATVDRSATARVFQVERDDDWTLYACLRRGGALQQLATWFSCECSVGDESEPFAELFAGHFVVVTHYPSCGPFPCQATTSYTLRNLRSRRQYEPEDDVNQVVTAPGRFAYEDGRVVLVRGGRERVVDPGPGVEPGSLAFAGTRLYWMRDGAPQSVAD